MAFHFDARADSSEDEDTAVDLSQWTAGARQRSPAGISASLLQSAARQAMAFNDSGSEKQASPRPDGQEGQETPRSASPPLPSFQAINQSSQVVGVEDDSDEELQSISLPDITISNTANSPDQTPAHNVSVCIRRNAVNTDEFVDMTGGSDVVRRVLHEIHGEDDRVLYTVLLGDFNTRKISLEDLQDFDNGVEALRDFDNTPSLPDNSGGDSVLLEHTRSKRSAMPSTRSIRRPRQMDGFVSTVDHIEIESSEDELAGPSARTRNSKGDVSEDELAGPSTRTRKRKLDDLEQYMDQEMSSEEEDLNDQDEEDFGRGRVEQRRRHSQRQRTLRSSTRRNTSTGLSDDDLEEHDDGSDSEDYPMLDSDLAGRKRQKPALRQRKPQRASLSRYGNGRSDRAKHVGQRQSERSTRHIGGMREVEIDDIYRDESDTPEVATRPKQIGVREVFKILPRNDEFRMRHIQYCEICGQGSNFAPLIDCQGCSLAYHKSCLGHRTNREHLVTKIGEGDFVLQCRRCTAFARKKDPTAPNQGMCQECRQPGASCRPFRPRKTPAQEQKEREDNDGVDPSFPMPSALINNIDNVLFRCTLCFRGFHFDHLPSRNDILEIDTDIDAEQRFREYSRDWKCKECMNMPAKVSGIVAWKPLDEDTYDPAAGIDGVAEDDMAYLVRWEGKSYFQARWMPGAWVWGVAAHSMRKAFAKREDAQHPKMRTEDAIPEDFLRTDIVLDIKFTSIVDIRTEEVDKARIREVDKALIKYKGLSYEDAVWEAPPSPEDGERWTDFVVAYNDWVAGRYVRQPKSSAIKARLEKARTQGFEKLEKQAQPEKLEGGELMKYQVEGLNWLYYKWFTEKNAILADEMGLGKTIQIIGFIATLVQDWNCYPFLVVVPNSTCPNWRREIKRWAPSLRVVAYYGSRDSRDAAYRYELYPEGSKDLRCHIVVTSYDAAADDSCRKFFRGVPWQGLIVDEGQRLKSSETQLYSALGALKAPFKILLTGTPLQNNQRELFNLLQFLDDTFDAAQLDLQYQELDQEKINELHELIRPFFLRRTKAQVLTFLPPMAQIILPVSMTIVQKKVYRSVLAKNPELMRAIFSTESGTVKQGERASLNNILMQLRKCLCHPFVYNKSIEDKNVSFAASHRNLVDASSKLKLLEVLLPKLQERGHRVLIFSQFLDMLDIVEDFLDGMTMRYHRLDGSLNSLTKQKRIDEFNAPGSNFFAFLLSTRAGGVGINLATADTVIILDPDFNPHQDIQALSRAHRIGQTKKVLCFQLVTRASAEERIMQVGRKKLALDHVLIQEMDADDANETDLVSILRHGANELFESNPDQDITYDGPSVDRLLDRSHMEDTQAGQDKSAETQFSFARVWANDQSALEDAQLSTAETAPDPGVWANILKERERIAAEEAAAKAESFGRGRRARANIDYGADKPEGEGLDSTPNKIPRKRNGDESDTDFQADDSDGDEDVVDGEQDMDNAELTDLRGDDTKRPTGSKKSGKPHPQFPTPTTTPEQSRNCKKAKTLAKPGLKVSAPPVKKSLGMKGKVNRCSIGSRLLATSSTTKPKVKRISHEKPKVRKPNKRSNGLGATPNKARSSSKDSTSGHGSASPRRKSAIGSSTVRGTVARPGQSAALPIHIDDDDDAVPAAAPTKPPTFRRVVVPPLNSNASDAPNTHNGPPSTSGSGFITCHACRSYHAIGSCPLKLAGVEYCNLCGMAHFGHARVCPHIQSETQVRAMLEALRYSNEPEHLVNEAKRYLRGLKGNLVQLKKQKELKEHAAREVAQQHQRTMAAPWMME